MPSPRMVFIRVKAYRSGWVRDRPGTPRHKCVWSLRRRSTLTMGPFIPSIAGSHFNESRGFQSRVVSASMSTISSWVMLPATATTVLAGLYC